MEVLKYCKKCDSHKNPSDFGKDKRWVDGLRKYCRECNNRESREWGKKNPERKKQKRTEWYENNKDRHNAKARDWVKNNRDVVRKNAREWQANRRCTDPLFKLQSNLSCLIRNSTKSRGFSKKTRAAQILGCSYDEFVSYIEAQFTEGMLWDNYGEWEFDHKIPVSWAKDEDEMIRLHHYKNFQPLWKLDNIKKGNRFASISTWKD